MASTWKPMDSSARSRSIRLRRRTKTGTTTIHGGAGSFNSNFEIFKNFKIYETAFFSSGGGREIGNTNVPDFIVTPAASASSVLGLSPVRSDAGILGFEYQARPKFLVYGYYGYVYVGQDFASCGTAAAPTTCGYGYYPIGGAAGSGPTNNRSRRRTHNRLRPDILEKSELRSTFAHYPILLLITQPLVRSRNGTGTPKNAHLGMAYIDLRYTLP